jgi:hypothetical protein
VTGYEDNLACVEVCNSFPKWGRRDQKRKFVFADNKILLMRKIQADHLIAELGLILAMVINNWHVLVPLVVVRISFVSLSRPFMDFGKTLNE